MPKKKLGGFEIISARITSGPAKKGGPKKKEKPDLTEIENYSIPYSQVTEATHYLQCNEKGVTKEYLVIRTKNPLQPNEIITLEWKAGVLTKIAEIKVLTGRCIESKITEVRPEHLEGFVKELK